MEASLAQTSLPAFPYHPWYSMVPLEAKVPAAMADANLLVLLAWRDFQ